ncbi:MAG: LysM peptidoglycan-binding domain-containing protein [Oculatellaceae cyanobacterium Prado106]|jgi:nucleoid-associated protein YgaU/pimeloyl-ACP methyl ester carboxylesterase|nr:LysM peptidoglycan-binding domain-containing protein [Oculatellaceae cyanobacterium Prado106]
MSFHPSTNADATGLLTAATVSLVPRVGTLDSQAEPLSGSKAGLLHQDVDFLPVEGGSVLYSKRERSHHFGHGIGIKLPGKPVHSMISLSQHGDLHGFEKLTAKSPTVEVALKVAQNQLQQLATRSDRMEVMQQSFGTGANTAASRQIMQRFAKGDFSQLPNLVVLPAAKINGANGAFAAVTNTIYLSQEFLAQNLNKPAAITEVLLEEIGHSIDAQINGVDTPGDEGEAFSMRVREMQITPAMGERLRLEDDRTLAQIDHQTVILEQNRRSYTMRSGDTLWGIAQRELGNGNRWREITKENGQPFTDEETRRLPVGQVVYIPGNKNTPAPSPSPSPVPTILPPANRRPYTIQSGDMLTAIAQRNLGNANRWREITKENGQSFTEEEARRLQIGQVVYLPGNAPIPTPSPSPAPAITPANRRSYTIQSGDMLSTIAQRSLGNANRWREITKENGQPFTEAEARNLRVGQVVFLPGGSKDPTPSPISSPSVTTRRNYVIRPGDSLSVIAQRELGNANRWREITKANGQSFTDAEARNLQIGQTVLLPGSNQNSAPILGGSAGGTGRLPTTLSEANRFFKLQYRGAFNPTGPSRSGNCGPASLAIALSALGREPAGLSIQDSINRASRLMGRDPNAGWTSWAQLETGIRNAGGSPVTLNSWNALDARLAANQPVILNGFYGANWRRQFPNYSQTGDGNILHVNTVLGRTSAGKYIVADPMYQGGTVEMTRQQLSAFFSNGNPVGIAVTGLPVIASTLGSTNNQQNSSTQRPGNQSQPWNSPILIPPRNNVTTGSGNNVATPTVISNRDWIEGVIGTSQGGENRSGKLRRIGDNKIENKPTWIVIHGMDSSPSGEIDNLAKAIDEYRRDDQLQVLTLDWSQAAKSNVIPAIGGSWIPAVANFVVETLKSWNIPSSSVSVAGHSLGAFVGYEIAKQFGGIDKLVALDPATTTLWGYSGDDTANFSQYSKWSWGFYSSLLGDEERTRTAHESFKLEFPWTNFSEGHGAGVKLWTNMLKDPNGNTSKHFGLEDMNSIGKPWHIDNSSGWEAQIRAKDTDSRWGADHASWVPETWWEL